MKPFVDFYRHNGISPVSQDISDRQRHSDRREALYRHLGLVPAWLVGRRVIEFGPGSGYNALYTLSLGPAKLVLVDGNPFGLKAARTLLGPEEGAARVEYIEEMVEEFERQERYDLVLCEGTIPFQLDPPAFLRRVAGHAGAGGVVVTTCVDGVSMLAETLRRLLATLLTSPEQTVAEKLAVLMPVFSPHLATLKGMSRPHEDWILDQLVQPLVGRLLSIDDAIAALDSGFDVHGASPHFFTDWRWYKDIHGSQRAYNDAARGAYYRNLHNLLDYRFVGDPRPVDENRRLLALGDEIFYLVQRYANEGRDQRILDAVQSRLSDLVRICRAAVPRTAEAFDDFQRVLRAYRATGRLATFEAFSACFGRGQQYLSFIHRA